MKHLCLLLLLISSSFAFATDFVNGFLIERDGDFYIKNENQELKIETTDLIKKSLPSLAKPSFVKQSNGIGYSYEFRGEFKGHTFVLDQTPTNLPGDKEIKGVYSYDQEEKKFYIGATEITFGYTKVLNRYQFDEISKKSFINKKVQAQGRINEQGMFEVQAIIPEGLLSARPTTNISNVLIKRDPEAFMFKTMNKNKWAKRNSSFRATLFQDYSEGPIKPGDTALIVTLSGRQGDSFGSVNGHFVAGLATVKDNYDLRGEVSNAYVTNGKDILSGNNSLINYFSHFVQGQNIYRPTQTVIIYGISKEKLQKFRDSLEASHIEFRTKKLDISADFNCTTETIKSLDSIGVVGAHRGFLNTSYAPMRFLGRGLGIFGDQAGQFGYASTTNAAEYQPRAAFESIVKNFLKKKYRVKHGVKRIDFMFYGQIPSQRPTGGAALGSTLQVGARIMPFVKARDAIYYKGLYDEWETGDKKKRDTMTKKEYEDFLNTELDYIE